MWSLRWMRCCTKSRLLHSNLNPALPVQLEGIIGRAMEKDREKRYHNAPDIKADLQRLKKESESAMLRSAARQIPLRLVTKTFASSFDDTAVLDHRIGGTCC